MLSKIKRIVCLWIMLFIPLVSCAHALPTIQKNMLSWIAPTTNVDGSPLTDLKGYKVYWSSQSGIYTDLQSKDVGNVVLVDIKKVIGNLTGTYYFVVTAIDIKGNESAFSNEVSTSFFSIAVAPSTLRIK